MNNIFIAGCGYIGERVARLAREGGCRVTCTTRSAERAAHLESGGFETLIASFDDIDAIPSMDPGGCVLFYLVPPPGGGIYDQRARNFRQFLAFSPKPAKIIYMSTTSVYTARDGSVVTEGSPTHPVSSMGKRRLDAERTFTAYGAEHGVAVIILRVSGIYGPGRLPLTQIRQGQPLLRLEESGPSNRIHANDLAQVCMAAAEKGEDGELFNVSDGTPCSMTEYFNAVADALGEPRQPQVTMEEAHRVMTPLMLSYVSESRVVDSSRLFRRLGVTLRYPNLQDGIRASVPSR
jgi:nucleoside-diphosphate-sugar epimerase